MLLGWDADEERKEIGQALSRKFHHTQTPGCVSSMTLRTRGGGSLLQAICEFLYAQLSTRGSTYLGHQRVGTTIVWSTYCIGMSIYKCKISDPMPPCQGEPKIRHFKEELCKKLCLPLTTYMPMIIWTLKGETVVMARPGCMKHLQAAPEPHDCCLYQG